MRLLEISEDGEIRFTGDLMSNIPEYAILSHTWSDEEVTYKHFIEGSWKNMAGAEKIKFCAEETHHHQLRYFWVDSCCIDKSSSAELAEAINSMFSWYQKATRCYVYLTDVSTQSSSSSSSEQSESSWTTDFENSRWFTRGWTLQELIAPSSVEFYSKEGHPLGDRASLEALIHSVTGIDLRVLRGAPLADFTDDDRMRWCQNRTTTRPEDAAYCLMGIFGVYMPLIYGEGKSGALRRLREEIEKDPLCTFRFKSKTFHDIRQVLQEHGTALQEADEWVRNEHYNKEDRLEISRLSGESLPMAQCYVNLAIVKHSTVPGSSAAREGRQGSPFSFLARQKVETLDKKFQVELEALFNERKGPGGQTLQPRRILIRGRAGIGKTTLCKKIVHEFTQGKWDMWSTLFDRILWIPLRKLKLAERQKPEYNFEDLFRHEFFSGSTRGLNLSEALNRALNAKRTLFLLDGLDEVSQDLPNDDRMSSFLKELLAQPNVIITSRPFGKLPSNLDLELETVGFNPEQVTEYLRKTLDHAKADAMNVFLKKHWLIQGVMRIPILVDALCFIWDDIESGDVPETMSGIYARLFESLWKKDACRLDRTRDFEQDAYPAEITRKVQPEINLLECLAFNGMYGDIIEFTPAHREMLARNVELTLPLDKTLAKLSFLRTSDRSLRPQDRNYHFIHLTFQEFFAAKYFVRQWMNEKPLKYIFGKISESNRDSLHSPVGFLQAHKYTARYNMFWRFVAGILEAEDDSTVDAFFRHINEGPVDLLGPAHQRLIMHCLSEMSPQFLGRNELEKKLYEWLYFELQFTEETTLAAENEFPEHLLYVAIVQGPAQMRKSVIQILRKRAAVSSKLLQVVVAELDGENQLVEAAASYLGKQFDLPDAVLQAIALRLYYESETARLSATQILGRQSNLPETALNKIILQLDDESWRVRRAAIIALSWRSPLPDTALYTLILRLNDEKKCVQETAIEFLGNRLDLPNTALQAILSRLDCDDSGFGRENDRLQAAASGAIGRQSNLPNTVLQAIISRIYSENITAQIAAIRALDERSDLPDIALEAIFLQLDNSHPRVREAAIDALSRRSDLPDTFLQAIISRLEDKSWKVRYAAMNALHWRSNLPDTVLQAIASRLLDVESVVREAAIKALGRRSSLPETFLQAIISRLEDKSWKVQYTAMEALGKQSCLPDTALEAIISRLEDNCWEVQYATVEALRKQSSLPDIILQAIMSRLEHNSEHVRVAVIKALGWRSDLADSARLAIISRLGDNSSNVRCTAIRALAKQSSLPYIALEAIILRPEDNS
ncbi:Vegetative incompatibility protein [Paramyrothecium foliicola]|nr:Vegetative incompatibility protein [Paramyrothecium foliicola]